MPSTASRPVLRAAAAALAVLSACSQAPDQRVRVGGEAASRLVAAGGKVLQDYGAFQVIEAGPAALATLAEGEAAPVDGRILLNAGAFDPGAPAVQAARATALPAKGRTLALVQLAGPVRPEWRAALLATGARIVAYIPNDAYLVWGDAAALGGLNGLARAGGFVRWAGAYLASDKLDPSTRTVDTGAWSIQLVEDDEANADTLAAVMLVERKVTRSAAKLGYLNLVVHCGASELAALAARPDVVSIQPYVEPTLNDERQAMLVSGHVAGNGLTGPGYLAWLASKGFTQAQFTASAFGVDLTDSGLDNATLLPNHFGLYVGGDVTAQSRVAYARLEGTPNAGSTIQGCDGHGNVNAHIIAGYVASSAAPHVDAGGYHYGVGIAPFVRVGSSVAFDPGSFTSPDYEDLQSRAWADGMRISSNSWGASTPAYTADAQRYDALVRDAAPAGSARPVAGNQEMVIVFSAGNGGSGAGTVGSPGTAKNVITVGGSEGIQPFGGSDNCGVADTAADSFQDIAFFSSRGPTADGRRKPEIVAPATHVSGAVAQAAGQRADPPASATGQALSCFDGGGVCGGVAANFFPAGQQWYTASSGTSHSTPAVAGAAALVRQWFLNHGSAAPSPAMTKAYLVNSARYLTGAGANDTLPSNAQGMGFLDLGFAFDETPRHAVDQDPIYLLTATGQTAVFAGSIVSGSAPVRVTLAWTDAPGSTTGAAWNNNLDLTVTVGGNTYRGNVFSGATSTTGGAADASNNVESVFLPAGASGPIVITVTAASIASDGVPNNGIALDQDFALVAYNVAIAPPPDAPTGVTATAIGANQVEVSWTTTGASHYRVYRGTTAGGPYAAIGTVTAPPFLDATVSGLTTYYYVVRAVELTESASSNEASATATGACTLPPVFAGATAVTSNGAATCGNTVTWAAATPLCGGTIGYEVYRSTSPTFAPGIANRIATGVTGTSFSDDANLASGTTYHYVVRATETADRPVTETNAVVRSALAGGPVSQDFLDSFDTTRPANAAAYWIPVYESGTAGTLNLTTACHYQSASSAYRFGATSAACGGQYPNSVVALLSLGGNGTTPGINGFLIGGSATLEFRHWYSFESRYDGAYLVYSTTGSTGPWTQIPDSVTAGQPYITQGGYVNTLVTGERGWTTSNAGANGALAAVTVNLDALAGRRAWFAWRFRTDSSVTYEGYYVDDVRISSRAACTTHVPPPGPAVAFAVSAPAGVTAGVATTVGVTALDAVGLVATGYAGTGVVTSSDGRAVLPAPIAFAAGAATASVELRTAGPQTVTVSDQVTPSITGSGAVAVTAAAPAALAFSAPPAAATAGAVLSPAVRVRIDDAFGNATAATDPVTIALGANPGNDTLGGTLTVTPVGGVATFADLVLTRAAAGYTLTASAGAYAGATSGTFSVAPAAAAALDFVQQASTIVAGDPITPAPSVAIRDAYGNLTASEATVAVALSAGTPGAALSGTAAAAAVAGVATFPGLSVDRVGQGYQLVASSAGLTGATGAGFGITHAAPDRLVYVQGPSDLVAGDAFTPSVSVEALDRFGNPATGFVGNVTLALEVNPTFASLTGLSTVTALGGVATFPGVSIERAGTGYVLSASSGNLGRARSAAFRVAAGPVTQLVFGTEPASAVAGAAMAGPTVFLADAHGNRQAAASDPITVALGANPGGDTLAGTLTVNAVAGGATFSDLVLRKAAAGYTLVATSGGATPATSAAFAVAAAAPAALQFVGAPSAAVAGSPLTPVPSVRVVDAHGNTATSASTPVTVALGANPASGTLSGLTSAPSAAGVAQFPGLSIDVAGAGYTLAATSPGLTPATTGAFAVTPGAPAALVLLSQPGTVQAGAPIGPLTVELRDAQGNRTAAATDVLVGIATAPGSATLGGTRRVAAVAGRAVFPDLTLDRAGSGYALSAIASGLPVAVTAAFDVTPAAAARLAFTALPSSLDADAAASFGLVAYDAFGNVATGYAGTVHFTSSDPGATLPADATFAAGVATALPIRFHTGGTQTLTATDLSNATLRGSAATAVLGPTVGEPAVLVFLSQPGTAQAGAPIGPLTVEIRDAYGNRSAATAEVLVGIATAPGGATLGGTRRVSAVAGRAVFSDLTLDRAGTGYALSAVATGLPVVVTSAFDVTPGAAARLAFTALPASVDADVATTIGLVAHDAFGNVATGYAGTAHFTSTDPAATLPADPTFAAGVASGLRVQLRTRGSHTLTVADVSNAALRGSAAAAVIGPTIVAKETTIKQSGCGCGAGNPGELGLLLALGALWRAAVTPRRRAGR